MLKKKDKKERKQKRHDLMKQMDIDIERLIKYLNRSLPEGNGPRIANADVNLSEEDYHLKVVEEYIDVMRQQSVETNSIKLPNEIGHRYERDSIGNRSSIMRTPESDEIIGQSSTV